MVEVLLHAAIGKIGGSGQIQHFCHCGGGTKGHIQAVAIGNGSKAGAAKCLGELGILCVVEDPGVARKTFQKLGKILYIGSDHANLRCQSGIAQGGRPQLLNTVAVAGMLEDPAVVGSAVVDTGDRTQSLGDQAGGGGFVFCACHGDKAAAEAAAQVSHQLMIGLLHIRYHQGFTFRMGGFRYYQNGSAAAQAEIGKAGFCAQGEVELPIQHMGGAGADAADGEVVVHFRDVE